MEKNWTTGSVLKNIIMFAIPYLFSILLQSLYGVADLFIIGQFNGTESITAVSIGSQIMHMVTLAIVGLAMGSTITIAKAIGSTRIEKASLSIGNSVTVFMTGAILLMGILLTFIQPILWIMSTPVEAVEGTADYLKICFLGIPFITAYNLISAILRGLGDSKTPMYFITVAFVCNVLLDYLFIGEFGLGAVGAALGTTFAQAISVITALFVVLRRKNRIKLKRQDFRLEKNMVGTIFKIGLPVCLQNSFIQVSFLAITVFVNMRGLYDAAAVGIVEKVIGVLFLVPSSMMSTVSALSAQNLGANQYGRVKKTLKYGIIICILFGSMIAFTACVYSAEIVGLFEKSPLVISRGSQYMKGYVWDCMFAGIHFCFSGYFYAMEKSGLSFIHNFFSIVCIRIPGSYFATKLFLDTLFPLGLVSTSGSIFSMVFCMIAFWFVNRNYLRKEKSNESRR